MVKWLALPFSNKSKVGDVRDDIHVGILFWIYVLRFFSGKATNSPKKYCEISSRPLFVVVDTILFEHYFLPIKALFLSIGANRIGITS